MPVVKDYRHRFWTPANLVSIGRLLLLVPLFVFLRQGRYGNGNDWAILIMGIALLSDLLDGMIARTFHHESDWGRVLDPLADKIWIGCLALFLAMPWREHPLPWWFLALVLARDVTIVACGYHAYRRTGRVMVSHWVGKITMVAEAATLIAYTIQLRPGAIGEVTAERLLWLAVAMILLSSAVYFHRFRATLAGVAGHSFPPRTPPPLKASP